jgi:L-rhamnose isomerase
MEECKTLPFAAVWDKLCLSAGVPVSAEWLSSVNDYEQKVLNKRK